MFAVVVVETVLVAVEIEDEQVVAEAEDDVLVLRFLLREIHDLHHGTNPLVAVLGAVEMVDAVDSVSY